MGNPVYLELLERLELESARFTLTSTFELLNI